MRGRASLYQERERLRPYVEKASQLFGWNTFPALTGLAAGPPWDYVQRARELLASASSVLDIGTGGGEVFSEVCRQFSGRATATEGWHVNAPVATARLQPLGVGVVHCSDLHLPFADSSFDVVLNRQAFMDPRDVARVLRPGGTVLTQQISRHRHEVGRFIPRKEDFSQLHEEYRDSFLAAGLQVVDTRNHEWPVAYKSLGDLIFMLCITPWTIPDFDPLGDDLDALLDLERELMTADGIILTHGNATIEAYKPSPRRWWQLPWRIRGRT
jgi:SAM-dependent methyltransferase